MNKNIPITWKEFFEAQDFVVKQIKNSDKTYKYIVALACGGLLPSYVVAKSLGIPIVTINLQSYSGKDSGEIQHTKIAGFSDEIQNQKDALIVDDIYDSGKTIKYIQRLYPSVDTAVTYARHSDHTATYVGKILNHEHWLDFPWEVKFDDTVL